MTDTAKGKIVVEFNNAEVKELCAICCWMHKPPTGPWAFLDGPFSGRSVCETCLRELAPELARVVDLGQAGYALEATQAVADLEAGTEKQADFSINLDDSVPF